MERGLSSPRQAGRDRPINLGNAYFTRSTVDPEEWRVQIVPEYALACKRYLGEEDAAGWLDQVGKVFIQMARIAVQPEWVGILDFEQCFPSAIERAMAGATERAMRNV